jgi:sulfur-oxidizing protein SoxA
MARRAGLARRLAAIILVGAAVGVWAGGRSIHGHEVDGRKSGYLFLTPATRALQDDEFLNPGAFALDLGRELWAKPDGLDGKSCASCHGEGEAAMRGVAARYPAFDAETGGPINLENRINRERERRMRAGALTYQSPEMLALVMFVTHQSRGQPMRVDIDGPLRPAFERGRAYYHARRGQLDLACNQCHEDRVGARLRGDVISQGQINAFPIHRLTWSALASRHRMFEWCNTSVRAEPHALGSPEYLDLEVYLAWRGRGLPIESPAVRR